MTLDELSTVDVDPDAGEVVDRELAVTDDVLLKAFFLGPGATIDPHTHADSTNVFHLLRGTVVAHRDGTEERLTAPAVIRNDRGQTHGARNDGDDTAVLTAALCPFPG